MTQRTTDFQSVDKSVKSLSQITQSCLVLSPSQMFDRA